MIAAFIPILALLIADNTAPVEVSIELSPGGHVLVPAHIGDGPRRYFLLDTGSSGTVLDREVALQHELPLAYKGEMVGAGAGSIRAEGTPQIDLHLPLAGDRRRAFSDRDVTVIPLRETLAGLGHDVVGVIGGTFLRQYVVTLDRAAKKMTLHMPEAFRPPSDVEALPLRLVAGFPVIPGSVVPLKRGVPQPKVAGNVLLDIGANHGVVLSWRVVDQHKLVDAEDPTQRDPAAFGTGITGATAPFRIAQAREVRLGEVVLRDVEIALTTAPGGGPPIPDLIGYIGTEVLGETFTLDYPHQKLWAAVKQ